MWKLGHREAEWPPLSHTARHCLDWHGRSLEVSNISSPRLQYLYAALRFTLEKNELIEIV